MKLSTLTDAQVKNLATKAKTDALLFECLLSLSALESKEQCRRIDKALGIKSKDRMTLLLIANSSRQPWNLEA